MGIFKKGSSAKSQPERAWYPSGPKLDGSSNRTEYQPKSQPEPAKNPNPNPDPANWQIIRAEERDGILVVRMRYPDCTNYEGEKILAYQGVTLVSLVNQKVIDPHFFQDKRFASPIARFVPTDDGWEMAMAFARAWAKR